MARQPTYSGSAAAAGALSRAISDLFGGMLEGGQSALEVRERIGRLGSMARREQLQLARLPMERKLAESRLATEALGRERAKEEIAAYRTMWPSQAGILQAQARVAGPRAEKELDYLRARIQELDKRAEMFPAQRGYYEALASQARERAKEIEARVTQELPARVDYLRAQRDHLQQLAETQPVMRDFYREQIAKLQTDIDRADLALTIAQDTAARRPVAFNALEKALASKDPAALQRVLWQFMDVFGDPAVKLEVARMGVQAAQLRGVQSLFPQINTMAKDDVRRLYGTEPDQSAESFAALQWLRGLHKRWFGIQYGIPPGQLPPIGPMPENLKERVRDSLRIPVWWKPRGFEDYIADPDKVISLMEQGLPYNMAVMGAQTGAAPGTAPPVRAKPEFPQTPTEAPQPSPTPTPPYPLPPLGEKDPIGIRTR